jgi:NAD(P)-dependent dehydrogenase (short-subunit alcohol dehydrogenase family)
MPSVQIARDGIAALPKGPPLVVALVSGTTGIGSYVARALAEAYAKAGDKLRVYIVGRRIDRAEAILGYGRDTSPGSDWRFIQVSDLSLMSEVDGVSREIISREEKDPFAGGPPRLNVLYMSQALSPLQSSDRKRVIPLCLIQDTHQRLQLRKRASTPKCHYSTIHACASSRVWPLYLPHRPTPHM